jgi:hypothetical protein
MTQLPSDRIGPSTADHSHLDRVILRVVPPRESLEDGPVSSSSLSRQSHPAGRARLHLVTERAASHRGAGQDGSLVAEYGLLLVLGATITMLATKWASGGAIWQLFGSVLARASALVGL